MVMVLTKLKFDNKTSQRSSNLPTLTQLNNKHSSVESYWKTILTGFICNKLIKHYNWNTGNSFYVN